MSRDILTNKWVLSGVGFLIVLSVACVLWYQHDTADERKAAAEAEQLLRQSEITKKATDMDSETEQAADVALVESEMQSAEKPIADTTRNNDTTNIETNTDNSVTPTPKNVRTSPHGFGAYPQIPEGSPIGDFLETDNVQQELIGRVLVKLWNEGDRHTGGGIYDAEQGKVYPYYPNVIYVKYENEFNVITGKNETKVTEATSSPDNAAAVDAAVRGNVPSGYTLIDIDETGINPYEYLALPVKPPAFR